MRKASLYAKSNSGSRLQKANLNSWNFIFILMVAYRYLTIAAIAAIAGIGVVITLSLSKGTFSSQDYEVDLDPFKDPQNLFVTARVMVQNTGGKELTNVRVDFGAGHLLVLGTLEPGQKVILSPPDGNPLEQVTVTADNGIAVTKPYRIPPKMPGMMGS
jgi:hypothetical protein